MRNFKKVLLILPTILLPYVFIGLLVFLYLSGMDGFVQVLMERLFNNNGLWLLLVAWLYFVITVGLYVIYVVLAIKKKWDPLKIARMTMIIKWIHFPIFVAMIPLIFILIISVFTIVFAIILGFMMDALIVMTGILNVVALRNAVKKNVATYSEMTGLTVLQFIFLADAIGATIFYVRLKKRLRSIEMMQCNW